jgi:hypothetical protein
MSIDQFRSITLLVVVALCAATASAETPDDRVELKVKPSLCVTGKRGQACETSFLVQWLSAQVADYCLRDDIVLTPLRCWQQDNEGNFEQTRMVRSSFSYQLTEQGQGLTVAEARVELLSLESNDRRRSRRNRHAWSIR